MKVLKTINVDLFFTLKKIDESTLDREKHGSGRRHKYFECPINQIVKKYGLPLRGFTKNGVTYNWLFKIEYGNVEMYIHITNLRRNDTTKWIAVFSTDEPLSDNFIYMVLNNTIGRYLGVELRNYI